MTKKTLSLEEEKEMKLLFKGVKEEKIKNLGRGPIIKAAENNMKILVFNSSYDEPYNIVQFAYAKKVDYYDTHIGNYKEVNFNEYDIIIMGCDAAGFNRYGDLKEFVKNGGWVLTTDWCLLTVVENHFSGVIRAKKDSGGGVFMEEGNAIISCEITDPLHPFLAGIAETIGKIKDETDPNTIKGPPKFKWWVEAGSYVIEILDLEKASVLIESAEAKARWGAAPVLVYFPYGKGLIIHFLSHIHLQQGGPKGKVVGVMIITNIMDELCSFKYIDQVKQYANKLAWV